VGFAQYAVCRACCQPFDLDPERDELHCPDCASPNIAFARDAVGESCPQCHRGTIEKGSPIRWKLDPDWERLPVPQIVKEVVEYRNSYTIARSLEPANHAASQIIGEQGLDIPTLLIVRWTSSVSLARNESFALETPGD
jgi:hypothetical protein